MTFSFFKLDFSFIGNGRYQYTLLLVCGVIFMCVGCQYGANAYILPSAECDLNMRSEEKGLLNVAFLLGKIPDLLNLHLSFSKLTLLNHKGF